jgi:RAT1-interacting protein
LVVSRGLTLESQTKGPPLSACDHLEIRANAWAQEITCFSYDAKHQFRLDASSLRYYYPPHLPADLNRGFDSFQQLDDTNDDHLDGLVDAIASFEKEKGAKAEADIITWRGMMTKV